MYKCISPSIYFFQLYNAVYNVYVYISLSTFPFNCLDPFLMHASPFYSIFALFIRNIPPELRRYRVTKPYTRTPTPPALHAHSHAQVLGKSSFNRVQAFPILHMFNYIKKRKKKKTVQHFMRSCDVFSHVQVPSTHACLKPRTNRFSKINFLLLYFFSLLSLFLARYLSDRLFIFVRSLPLSSAMFSITLLSAAKLSILSQSMTISKLTRGDRKRETRSG